MTGKMKVTIVNTEVNKSTTWTNIETKTRKKSQSTRVIEKNIEWSRKRQIEETEIQVPS